MRGETLRTIFLDHWDDFFKQTSNKPRQDIIETVIKMLVCGTAFLGYQLYVCNACDRLKAVYHTCKSRFCSSYGKKATDNWIAKHLKLLPRTRYQHITFTLPKELQPILWLNRHLINALMPLPARILTEHARRVGVIPGIFAALHTSGRDLKRNIHFHLSTTLNGISPSSGKWIPYMRFNRRMLTTIKTHKPMRTDDLSYLVILTTTNLRPVHPLLTGSIKMLLNRGLSFFPNPPTTTNTSLSILVNI